MVKATLRTNTSKKPEEPPIDVEAEKIESTLGAGTGTGKPEDLTSLFLPEQDPAKAPPVDNDRVAPGRQDAKAVACYEAAKTEGFEGDWGADDVKFPQLKLVQGSGPLSQTFDQGAVIFAEEELLPPASVKEGAINKTLRFAPIAITKGWREKLSQAQISEGLMPRQARTLAEVEELGGTTRYVADARPDNYWEPSARCIFLIEQPKDSDHPGFALELDGKFYAVGVYYAAGIAFRDSAKVIFNTAMTSLLMPVLDSAGKPVIQNGRPQKRPMLYKNFWQLGFAKKTLRNSSFTPWEPVVRLLRTEETGPDVRAFCAGIAGNSTE